MPPARFVAALALFGFSLPLVAQDINLGSRLASGKWALNYERTGEIKPLKMKNKENGTSYTCIEGDARDKIVDWVGKKGCTVQKEVMRNGVYTLEGECRLKWWKSHPIPVVLELQPESSTRFNLNIKTPSDSLLGFTEHTKAIHQGPCDLPSAPKLKKNQGTQA